MKAHFPMKKGLLVMAVLFVAAFAFLSGCTSVFGGSNSSSAGENTYNSGYSDGSANYYPAVAPTYDSGKTAGTATTSTASTGAYTGLGDRKVIMTASVSLETADHDGAVAAIRNITAGAGGFVQSSGTWTTGDDRKQTSISVKVPAAQFESCLARIKALGTVTYESSSGQDVTMTYIDLSARLENLRAEESKLSEIMAMARNVSEVLAVEQELYRVRGEIESTQQQLSYLDSQVDFSTISATVSEPEPTVAYDWGIDTAFREGVKAFVGMIGALIVATGYLIPLVLYAAIALVILYYAVRIARGWYEGRKSRKAGKP